MVDTSIGAARVTEPGAAAQAARKHHLRERSAVTGEPVGRGSRIDDFPSRSPPARVLPSGAEGLMDPKQIYDRGIEYHHYANTAYPLTPGSFRSFRLGDPASTPRFLEAEWAKADEVSLYVHVPFCQTRCRFCEYAVLSGDDALADEAYLELLAREMALYAPFLRGKRIVGLDVGGGTPAKLSVDQLARIVRDLRASFDIPASVTWSIETTPAIAARDPEKMAAIRRMGFGRISMGIQTVSEKLLNELGREGTSHLYERAAANVRAAGFDRFNIDLMYGFLHQADEEFQGTVRYAAGLAPDYVTLYRNRYKGTSLEKEAGGVSLYRVIRQYRLAYEALHEHGYQANPGKNTFSRIAGDPGTSDYLTRRVIDGVPYLGLGLGAQSFGVDYLAYNHGAASKKLSAYREALEAGRFPVQDLYALPLEESIAKMVSVAFYFGFVDLPAFERRFHCSFLARFEREIAFLLREGLMERKGERLYLTSRGADHINGIIPLFYSERSKAELVELASRRARTDDGEARFLEAYDLEGFARPSLAVDIVAATRDGTGGTRVALIKRGDHPFMNQWALPGGFVRPGESAEGAAARELAEEAGITGATLTQLGLYSDAGRDPRGWIVSCAFLASCGEVVPRFGDDALDARMFTVAAERSGEALRLCLESGDVRLAATLAVEPDGAGVRYVLRENQGLALTTRASWRRPWIASPRRRGDHSGKLSRILEGAVRSGSWSAASSSGTSPATTSDGGGPRRYASIPASSDAGKRGGVPASPRV
jgi:oxygen-independent coproporphyrinogen-3 oxidase